MYRRACLFFLCICFVFLCVLCAFVVNSPAAEPCQSGLKHGERPGPYSFVVATGDFRGRSHCFICETKDRPAVVIFARSLSDPLGNLVVQVDKALAAHKAADLRAWLTLLSDDQPALDPKLVQWGQKHAIRKVPLGIFEDMVGPPDYNLTRDADVTVMLFVKEKVVDNFAFRAGELTDEKVNEVVKALPELVGAKK